MAVLIEPRIYCFGINNDDTEIIKKKILQNQIKKSFAKNEEICIWKLNN